MEGESACEHWVRRRGGQKGKLEVKIKTGGKKLRCGKGKQAEGGGARRKELTWADRLGARRAPANVVWTWAPDVRNRERDLECRR